MSSLSMSVSDDEKEIEVSHRKGSRFQPAHNCSISPLSVEDFAVGRKKSFLPKLSTIISEEYQGDDSDSDISLVLIKDIKISRYNEIMIQEEQRSRGRPRKSTRELIPLVQSSNLEGTVQLEGEEQLKRPKMSAPYILVSDDDQNVLTIEENEVPPRKVSLYQYAQNRSITPLSIDDSIVGRKQNILPKLSTIISEEPQGDDSDSDLSLIPIKDTKISRYKEIMIQEKRRNRGRPRKSSREIVPLVQSSNLDGTVEFDSEEKLKRPDLSAPSMSVTDDDQEESEVPPRKVSLFQQAQNRSITPLSIDNSVAGRKQNFLLKSSAIISENPQGDYSDLELSPVLTKGTKIIKYNETMIQETQSSRGRPKKSSRELVPLVQSSNLEGAAQLDAEEPEAPVNKPNELDGPLTKIITKPLERDINDNLRLVNPSTKKRRLYNPKDLSHLEMDQDHPHINSCVDKPERTPPMRPTEVKKHEKKRQRSPLRRTLSSSLTSAESNTRKWVHELSSAQTTKKAIRSLYASDEQRTNSPMVEEDVIVIDSSPNKNKRKDSEKTKVTKMPRRDMVSKKNTKPKKNLPTFKLRAHNYLPTEKPAAASTSPPIFKKLLDSFKQSLKDKKRELGRRSSSGSSMESFGTALTKAAERKEKLKKTDNNKINIISNVVIRPKCRSDIDSNLKPGPAHNSNEEAILEAMKRTAQSYITLCLALQRNNPSLVDEEMNDICPRLQRKFN